MQQEKLRQQETLEEASSKSLRINLLMGVFCIIVTFLALFFMLRKLIVVPISKVKTVLQEIGRGHLNTRLKLSQQDELGNMARTLDELSDSLQLEIVKPLEQLAAGDLTFSVMPRDDQDILRQAIKKLGNDMNEMIGKIKFASEQIETGSIQVSDAAQSLSQDAAESAASLEQITSSMNEIGSQISHSAGNATQTNHLASDGRNQRRRSEHQQNNQGER